LGEYVLVLRGIGLTEVAIARLHGAPEPAEGESIEHVLAQRLEQEPTEEQLFARLGKTIVDSERGIDAPATYWNSAPEVHLRELLAPYGCDVSFEPTRRADSLADGQFNVHITDAAGTRYHTRYEYPESTLGDDNYPALLHGIEEDLLSAAGLTFVRLRSPEERWRFMMLTVDQLDALQRRYGERIELFGEPLLASLQPTDFVKQDPTPVPDWYEPATEATDTGPDLDSLVDDEDFDEVTVDAGVSEPIEESVAGAETEEEIVQAVQPDTPGARTTGGIQAPEGTDFEASDNEVQSVFGDLSEVSLEKATDGGPAAATADADQMSLNRGEGASPATPESPDTPDPIDTLFEELEREVAAERPDAGEGQDADDATIAELVERVEEATDEPAREESSEPSGDVTSVSPEEFPDAPGSAGDESVLTGIEDQASNRPHSSQTTDHSTQESQDTTASELFARLNDDTHSED
jgi:hypothetical protein